MELLIGGGGEQGIVSKMYELNRIIRHLAAVIKLTMLEEKTTGEILLDDWGLKLTDQELVDAELDVIERDNRAQKCG